MFVSYHHHGDRWFYQEFGRLFEATYETVQDNSVEREIDSNDPEYVMRRIREEYLTGTSCTVVLCGAQTPWRKFVDWEIKATLDKQHALIGINLPTNRANAAGTFVVPDRLHDNLETGYAVWFQWQALLNAPGSLAGLIHAAATRSRGLIQNSRQLRPHNG